MALMRSRGLQPAELTLPLHTSANIGKDNNVAISLASQNGQDHLESRSETRLDWR